MRLVEVFLTYGLILHAAAAQNYYQLLGVKHTAPAADIKRSFRSLAKQYHPDKSGNKRDADRFMQVRKGESTAAFERKGAYNSRATL